MLVRYLARAGYETDVAGSVARAIDIAATNRPDLITLDLRLPDSDGRTVIGRLRADPATGQVPIVVASALPASEPVRRRPDEEASAR